MPNFTTVDQYPRRSGYVGNFYTNADKTKQKPGIIKNSHSKV